MPENNQNTASFEELREAENGFIESNKPTTISSVKSSSITMYNIKLKDHDLDMLCSITTH